MVKVLDKVLVEVCKPQEAFYFLYFHRSFLFLDYLDLVVLH